MNKLKQLKFHLQAAGLLLLSLAFAVHASYGSAPSREIADNLPAREAVSDSDRQGDFDTCDKAFVGHWLSPSMYLPLGQIRPGMLGYGLTVFHGEQVERFNVKIIGVVRRVLYGQDAILARLSGSAMEKNSIIKGMSGSPVYIGGKLIGAVSFGYDFAKEPIVGITPIASMLDGLASQQQAPGPIAQLKAPYWMVSDSSSNNSTSNQVSVSAGSPHLVPLMAPVGLVGFSNAAEAFLAAEFAPIGLAVSSGASGAMDSSLNSRPASGKTGVRPGSAVSVLLSTGDFTTVATGTTTACFGKHVIAFGHPFLQAGSVDFPMATAYIHDILPSLAASFKVSSPISVVGSIVADRPWSIGGQIGRSAKLIPATYEVIDETRHVKRTYHCQIVNHPDLTPELLAATAMSAIDATHQSGGPYIAHVNSVIEADGVKPICRDDTFSSNFIPHWLTDTPNKFHLLSDPVGAFVLRTTANLTKNEYKQATIKSVNLKIRLTDGHLTARLDKVYLDTPFAHPGETLNIHCLLKPYNQEAITQTIALKLPDNLPDGNCLLAVVAGNELQSIKKRMGTAPPQAQSLEDMALQIGESGRGNAIIAELALPYQKVFANGIELINPPPQWLTVLSSNHQTKQPDICKASLMAAKETNWLIEGSHLITVEIKATEKALSRKPYPELEQQRSDDNLVATDAARKYLQVNKKPGANEGSASNTLTTTTFSAGGAQPISQPAPAIVMAAPNAAMTSAMTAALNSSKQSSTADGNSYPHMRLAKQWIQSTNQDFAAGKADNLSIDSRGRLQPGFTELATNKLSDELIVWSVACANGYCYYGTSDGIWRESLLDNKTSRVLKLDAAIVPAMVADAKGNIYFAKVSGGTTKAEVWRLDANDKAKLVASVDQAIISSLCVDDDGNTYAACANQCQVYKISAAGSSSLFFHCPETHALCLFYSPGERAIYVGTGDKGAVYSVDMTGAPRAVYQAQERSVTGIAKNKAGDLYIATANPGRLIRLTANNQMEVVATSAAFYTLAYNQQTDMVFSGDGEGDITLAANDSLTNRSYFIPISHTEQEAVMALTCDSNNHLFAATSNLASLHTFALTGSQTASYQSSIGDAQRPAKWSHLHTLGQYGQEDNQIAQFLQVETRTGLTSNPDATWSNWQAAPFSGRNFEIKSPPGRYLQYKLTWVKPEGIRTEAIKPPAIKPEEAKPGKLDNDSKTAIGKVEVSYLPANQSPTISSVSLKAGDIISGNKTITVNGYDPDNDNMLLAIGISSDGGTTWRDLATDLRTKSTPAAPDKQEDKQDSKLESKLESSPVSNQTIAPNVEQSDPDKADQAKENDGGAKSNKDANPPSTRSDSSAIDGQVIPDLAPVWQNDKDAKAKTKVSTGASTKKTSANKIVSNKQTTPVPLPAAKSVLNAAGEKFVYQLNTKKEKDGNYLLKFTLCDRLSNPVQYQQFSSVQPLTIDNKAPEIQFIEATRAPDGTLKLAVRVKDRYTTIANATYRLDDGEPYCLAFVDGAGDDLQTQLAAADTKLGAGSHKVEVKIVDQAGNTTSKVSSVK